MAERTESTDAEAARAEKLKGDGALTLELVGLSLEQFESVCRALRDIDLEYAVDAEGHLAMSSPTPAQVDELRTNVRHGRRDLERAVLGRLTSRRGSKWIAADDLTAGERDDVVSALAGRGHLATLSGADIVVERRGAGAAETLIDETLDGSGADADSTVDRSAAPTTGGRDTPMAPTGDLALAPYSKRFMGFVIDATAFLALALALAFIGQALGVDPAVGLLFGFVAWFMTSTILHARHGRTLGKTIMGTRVVDAETGEVASMGRSTVRGLVQFMPVVLWLGGILVAVATHAAVFLLPNRQGLHDRLARTVVVHDDDAGA